MRFGAGVCLYLSLFARRLGLIAGLCLPRWLIEIESIRALVLSVVNLSFFAPLFYPMDCGQHIIRIARIYKNRRYPFKDQLTRTVFATALPKVVIMAAADMGGDFCARGGVRAAGLFSFACLLLLVVADCLPYAVTNLRRP